MKAFKNSLIRIALLAMGRGFLGFLQAQDIPVEQQTSISRYDMVRLVEEATCNACLTPPQSWKQKYSSSRLVGFQGLLGNSFDEIAYEHTLFDSKDYYYCVAHAGDQGWINGYPRLTPGLCQGKFCGANNARGSELIQMMVNMIAAKIWNTYPVSFKAIKDWSLASGVVHDIESLGLINKGISRCGQKACTASSLEEFSLFMKYCSHHLSACGMKPIAAFPQSQWPIAELNVLIQANILSADDPMIARLGSIINGSDIARFLPALKQVTNCTSLDDYDGDGLVNERDNCPNDYNPKQANLDADKEGDVCDEDIDGDGSLNEKGLVDDAGTLIKKQKSGLDDCPTVSTEKLANQDCQSYLQKTLVAFAIEGNPAISMVGKTVDFQSTIVGEVDDLVRDFGDGTSGKGKNTTHSYLQDGVYKVTARAHSSHGRELVSQVQVVVGEQEGEQGGTTALSCNTLQGSIQTEFICSLRGLSLDMSQATMLRRSFGDGTQTQFPSGITNALVQSHKFLHPGTYTVQADLYFGLETFISQKLILLVEGDNICLTPNNACDLDKDSIPDQCDPDIDGDGVLNIVGLITKDLPDCSFSLENIDQQKYRDQITAIKKGVSYDNCFVLVNPGQEDSDLNGYGDICDSIAIPGSGDSGIGKDNNAPKLPDDSDGDGIADDRDACGDIPENENGVEDSDGCPELPSSCKPGSQCSGKAPTCTTCPCPGADYSSELWKGDRIRAILLDEAGQIIYRYSPAEVIDVNIPDKMLGR